MKKIITALTLFEKKVPNTEVIAIERVIQNWFTVTTPHNVKYTVNIGHNSVEPYCPDP